MKIEDPDLLFQFRLKLRCEHCGKRGPVDPHHLFSRGFGGGTRLDIAINLIALCRKCHDEFHNGKIKLFDLLKIVAKRHNRSAGSIEKEINRLIWRQGREDH